MGKTKLVRRIAEEGCWFLNCKECPLAPYKGINQTCHTMQAVNDTNSPAIRKQAQAWLDKRAEKKARKQAEKEPVQPAWDGEFVPGRTYMGHFGTVVLCTNDVNERNFEGTAIITGGFTIAGIHHGVWAKSRFRPVKVKITVEE